MNTSQPPSTSFGSAAGMYEAGRPEYPSAAVEWLLSSDGGPARRLRVADVGAGTGKLTRGIAAAGHDVIAVDPDPAMLETLRSAVPGVDTFVGTAEALPLPDASLDAVMLAQAWHWVEPIAGCREIGRVLAFGGHLGLVWNVRDVSESWVRQLNAIIGGGPTLDMFADGPPTVAEPFGTLEKHEWQWKTPMTRSQISASIRSRSAFITAEDSVCEKVEGEISALLDDLGLEGDATIDLPYITVAFKAVRT